MLKNLVILLSLLIQFSGISYAYSERDFDEMEYLKYGTVYAEENFASRLRRLETDVWGMSQSGSLDERINKLKKMTISENSTGRNVEKNNTNKSPIRNFFNNLSEIMSAPVMTGYTPSMDYYQNSYPNNIYKQGFSDFLNNGNNYCSYPNSYSRNHPPTYHNNYYNDYRYDKTNNYRRHPNRYYHRNQQYTPYQPTDIINNFTTRSSVHILQDWFYKINP